MAEAVVRVQRAAGELSRQVSALDRDSSAVVERLRRIDPQIAAASKNLDAYHEQLRAGGALSDQERFRMERLQRFVAARSEALSVQTAGRAPTATEVEAARATGRYTEERLAQMRMMNRGQNRIFPRPLGQVEAGIARTWVQSAGGEAIPEDAAVRAARSRISALEGQARARATAIAKESGVEVGSRAHQDAAANDPALQAIHAERKSLWRGLYAGPAPSAAAPAAPAETTLATPTPAVAPSPAAAPPPGDSAAPAPMGPPPAPPASVARPREASQESRPEATPGPAARQNGEQSWDFSRLNRGQLEKELVYAQQQLKQLSQHPAAATTIQSRISALNEEMHRRENPASAAGGGGSAPMRTREKQLALLLDGQLTDKWKEQSEALGKQQARIRDVGAEYAKLTATKKAGGQVNDEEVKTSETRLRQLYEERTETLSTLQALRNVGAERGLSFPRLPRDAAVGGGGAAAAAAGGGGGGWRQNAGVFLAGAGIGGGSIGGTIAGAALGALSWPKALLTVAGMGAGWAWRQGSGYAQSQEQTLQAGMTLGGGYRDIRRAGRRNLQAPLYVPYEETASATEAWGTQTGRRDLGAIPAFARLYGLGVGRTAAQLGGLARFGLLPRDRAGVRMVPRQVWREDAANLPLLPRVPPVLGPLDELAGTTKGVAASIANRGPISSAWQGVKGLASGAWGLAKEAGGVAKEAWRSVTADPWGLAKGVARYAMSQDPWTTPVKQQILPATEALKQIEADPRGIARPGHYETAQAPERTSSGGIAGVLTSAYRRSYGTQNRAFMEPYIGQYLQLAGVTARGGAPITPEGFGDIAGVQAAATRIYGRDMNPEFGGRLATSAIGTITHPRGDVARGVGIRSLAEMWGGMSEAERAEFKAATEKKFRVKGGLDPSTVPGAIATMENAFSIGGKLGDRVTRALTGGLGRLSGSGQVAEMFWGAQTGNQLTGIQMARNLERLRRGEKLSPESEGELRDQVTKALQDAGDEGKARAARAAAELAGLDVGKGPALLGEAIKTSVMNLISTLTETRELWNASGLPGVGGSTPMSPAPGTR